MNATKNSSLLKGKEKQKIRDENGDIAIDTTKTQRMVKEYNEQTYGNSFYNLDKFLKKLDGTIVSVSYLEVFYQRKAKDQMVKQLNFTKYLSYTIYYLINISSLCVATNGHQKRALELPVAGIKVLIPATRHGC